MYRSKWGLIAFAIVLAAAGVGFIVADDKPAGVGPARPTDEQAIRSAAQSLAHAFEKGDAKALAACFTEEGEYIDENANPVRGRAALAKAYAEFFAKRPEVKVESKTEAVRFIGKDTAVEEGTFKVQAKDKPAEVGRYSSLYVRQDGKWLVALLKEWTNEAANSPTLENLAWLIGTWESGGGDVTARTTYEWVENKKFIRAQYTITSKKAGVPGSSGMQVIGINPATGGIHGWTFDSAGGIGEASWSFDGDRWVIESAGVVADGSQTTANNFLTRHGEDSFSWKSVLRTMDGDSLPDLGPITVKRVSK